MPEEPDVRYTDYAEGYREGHVEGYGQGIEDGRFQGFQNAKYLVMRSIGLDEEMKEELERVLGEE